MNKVYVKTQGIFENAYVLKVFGSLESVNQDKLEYFPKAKEYIQKKLNSIIESIIKKLQFKTQLILNLEEAKVKATQDPETYQSTVQSYQQQLESCECAITSLKHEEYRYQQSIQNKLEAVDIWCKHAEIYYEEFDFVP